MQKLTRESLYSLEKYSEVRRDFRSQVMEHKKNRQVRIGPNATLYFEDYLTMKYQVQEMLRVERIFEADGIEEELGAYNPLIPDGSNWKATFMLEYPDVAQRREALGRLRGVEDRIWVQVEGCNKVWAIADEDLDREDEDKTSSVHFLRFELDTEMVERAKSGSPISMGIEHENYCHQIEPIPDNVRSSLAEDLS
jgi:hypothetical protein